jgi:polysaccharide export outer membrane protein
MIDITVYRHDDLKKSVKIDSSGKFMYPFVGDIDAAGKSIFKLRDEMKGKLSKYLVDPQVIIAVSSPLSRKVIVLGEVNAPGVFVLDTDTSFAEAVSKAGGPNRDANLDTVVLMRKNRKEPDKPFVATIPLKKLLREGDLSQNVVLRNGDIVYVPPKRIADVSRFAAYISQILMPLIQLESGLALWPQVKDALAGEGQVPIAIPIQ